MEYESKRTIWAAIAVLQILVLWVGIMVSSIYFGNKLKTSIVGKIQATYCK